MLPVVSEIPWHGHTRVLPALPGRSGRMGAPTSSRGCRSLHAWKGRRENTSNNVGSCSTGHSGAAEVDSGSHLVLLPWRARRTTRTDAAKLEEDGQPSHCRPGASHAAQRSASRARLLASSVAARAFATFLRKTGGRNSSNSDSSFRIHVEWAARRPIAALLRRPWPQRMEGQHHQPGQRPTAMPMG